MNCDCLDPPKTNFCKHAKEYHKNAVNDNNEQFYYYYNFFMHKEKVSLRKWDENAKRMYIGSIQGEPHDLNKKKIKNQK